MLLAVDVGNTTVNIGIFKNSRLVFQKKIPTEKGAGEKYYYGKFKKILTGRQITFVIISSVVPKVTRALQKSFKRLKIKTVILGKDLTAPIKNLYKNPKQVGQDRLVNACAGYKKFGGGLIIVDFGTAVTFDVVSKKGAYLGGIIVPGIRTSLSTLSQKAALLPEIMLKKPRAVIGADTVNSMLSGILNGYGALCDGLVARIKKETGKNYKIILTGGDAGLISKFCKFDSVEPDLTLEGLYLIHKNLV
ncbi:MAG: type III pantothenate kinase [Candidatus Omnitrophica bacterium]|nr:type III pantothenate kinase [Candidatus Omnitrophota bacterium]